MAERSRWQVGPHERRRLEDRHAAETPGAPGDKGATDDAIGALEARLLGLQDRLWAEARRAVLVVLQGIDASGKDGTISHVFRGLNPLGTHVAAFRAPSTEELAHDFLWRVHARCPSRGEIGIFNRSHYEDVLVARVHGLVPERTWRRRYDHIVAFESTLADEGTTVVKIFLHLSKREQLARFEQRRKDPTKQWKLSDTDLSERESWDAYRAAFEDMLEHTSTDHAPWYVVPADHKWYRNWAVSTILVDTLESMDPQYPAARTPSGS